MRKPTFLLYASVAFLFIALISFRLFSQGMFMDGLIYATISHNMANDIGSFWRPHFTGSMFPVFYEHPPLALGLQSLWFQLFGHSFLIERFYALFTYILSGVALVATWKELGQSLKTGWIPLFFWLMVSNVGWALANNMLENTMTVFVLLSAWACIKGINRKNLVYFIIGGLSLSLAMLTKGFVSLFIWALPFAWFLFDRKKVNFRMFVMYDAVLIISTVLPLVLLFFLSEGARHNMVFYFNKQVLGSIENSVTVGSRFAIFGEFIQHIAVPLILALIVSFIAWRRGNLRNSFNQNKKTTYILTFLLFCGIAPIMISLKQRGFYILSVYPFFGLIIGLIITPYLSGVISNLKNSKKALRILGVMTVVLISTSISISIVASGMLTKDRQEILDARVVIPVIGEGSTVNICPSQYKNFSMHGYYGRFGNVTLLKDDTPVCDYFIANKGECNPDEALYDLVPVKLLKHDLYRLKTESPEMITGNPVSTDS